MIHLERMGCGQRSPISMTLRFITQHMEWAAVLMFVFGCRRCIGALGRAL